MLEHAQAFAFGEAAVVDEHFGDVSVYFNQVEVPLPLRRTVTDAVDSTLVVTFQGCQTDGICYPPMTRRVKLSIPAGDLPAPFAQGRPLGSALYFMLTPQEPGKLHRIDNKQLYHHYLGDPIEVLMLHADGTHTLAVRAADVAGNSQPETVSETWNVKGYANNAWHRVTIRCARPSQRASIPLDERAARARIAPPHEEHYARRRQAVRHR